MNNKFKEGDKAVLLQKTYYYDIGATNVLPKGTVVTLVKRLYRGKYRGWYRWRVYYDDSDVWFSISEEYLKKLPEGDLTGVLYE